MANAAPVVPAHQPVYSFPLKLHGFAVVQEVQICHACDSTKPEHGHPVACVRTPQSFSSLGRGLKLKWLCAEHWNTSDLLRHLKPDEQPQSVPQPEPQPVPQHNIPAPPTAASIPKYSPHSDYKRHQTERAAQEQPSRKDPAPQPSPLHLRQSKSATCQKPPSSLDFIWRNTEKGMAKYLGHGCTRTVYSFTEGLVLKLGDEPSNAKERELSETWPDLCPLVHDHGEAKIWDEEGKRVLCTKHYLVSQRVTPLALVLRDSENPSRIVMELMFWLARCAKCGVLTGDAKVDNLGVREGLIVALDAGTFQILDCEVSKSKSAQAVLKRCLPSLKDLVTNQDFLDELFSIWRESTNLDDLERALVRLAHTIDKNDVHHDVHHDASPWPAWEEGFREVTQSASSVAPPPPPPHATLLTDSTFGHRLWNDDRVFHDDMKTLCSELPPFRIIGGNGGSFQLFHADIARCPWLTFKEVFVIPMNDACAFGDYANYQAAQTSRFEDQRIKFLEPIMALQAEYARVCYNPPYSDSHGILYKSGKKHVREKAFTFLVESYLRTLPEGALLICLGWNGPSAAQEFALQQSFLQRVLA